MQLSFVRRAQHAVTNCGCGNWLSGGTAGFLAQGARGPGAQGPGGIQGALIPGLGNRFLLEHSGFGMGFEKERRPSPGQAGYSVGDSRWREI